MATTAESFQDALAWVGRLLRTAVRRGAIMAALIGPFALAVWWTTRDVPSDCGDVTAEQTTQLESLREPTPDRRFVAATSPECVDGRFVVELRGLTGNEMESLTGELVDDGLALDREFIGFYFQLWGRCFRFPDPAWDRIEVNLWTTRDGAVHTIDASAPEEGDACDALRY